MLMTIQKLFVIVPLSATVFMTAAGTKTTITENNNNSFSPYSEIQYDDFGNKMMFLQREASASLSGRTIPISNNGRSLVQFHTESTNQFTNNDDCNVVYPVGACIEDGEVVCAIGPEACVNSPYVPANDFEKKQFKCLLCRDEKVDPPTTQPSASSKDEATKSAPSKDEVEYYLEYITDDEDNDCDIVFAVGACSQDGEVLICATGQNECAADAMWIPEDGDEFEESNAQCYLCRGKDYAAAEEALFESSPVDPEPIEYASQPTDFTATEPKTLSSMGMAPAQAPSSFLDDDDDDEDDSFLIVSPMVNPPNCPMAKKVGGCRNILHGRIMNCAFNEDDCDAVSKYVTASEFKDHHVPCFSCKKADYSTSVNSEVSTSDGDNEDDFFLIVSPMVDPPNCPMAKKVGGCRNILHGRIMNCAFNEGNCDAVSKYVTASEFKDHHVPCFSCKRPDDSNDSEGDSEDSMSDGDGKFFLEQYPGKEPPPDCEMSMRVGGCRNLHDGRILRCAFEEASCDNNNRDNYVSPSQFGSLDDPCYLCRGERVGENEIDYLAEEEALYDSSPVDPQAVAQPPQDNSLDEDSNDDDGINDSLAADGDGDFFLEQYPGDEPPDCDHFMKVGGCRSAKDDRIMRCAVEDEDDICGVGVGIGSFVSASEFGPNDDPCYLCRMDDATADKPAPSPVRSPTPSPVRSPTPPPTRSPTSQPKESTSVPFVAENAVVTPVPFTSEASRLPPPPSVTNPRGKNNDGENWGLTNEMSGPMGGIEIMEYDEGGSGALMTTLIVILVVMACIIFGLAFMIRRRRYKQALAEATGVGLPDNLIDRTSDMI